MDGEQPHYLGGSRSQECLGVSHLQPAGQESLDTKTVDDCSKVLKYVSDPINVKTGAGEVSVLGPIIFLIQILEVSQVMSIYKEKLEKQHPSLLSY